MQIFYFFLIFVFCVLCGLEQYAIRLINMSHLIMPKKPTTFFTKVVSLLRIGESYDVISSDISTVLGNVSVYSIYQGEFKIALVEPQFSELFYTKMEIA